jgi:hypothetical protein
MSFFSRTKPSKRKKISSFNQNDKKEKKSLQVFPTGTGSMSLRIFPRSIRVPFTVLFFFFSSRWEFFL